MKKHLVAGVIGVAMLVSACVPITPLPEAGATGGDPLNGTHWILTELNGAPALSETTVTLNFADGSATGSDGCNNYRAGYVVDGDAITFQPGMSTMMACPEPIMAQTAGFSAALAATSTYTTDGSTLALLDASGTAVATFSAVSTDLAGTSWDVHSYNNGIQAVVSLVAGSSITVEFGADGVVSGSSGCNTYSGAYTSDGVGSITIGPLASTRMMCGDPAVMEQEALFLTAMQTAAVYWLNGNSLDLRTAEDALAVSMSR
jgi:heat shock protein HslJ